MPSINKRITRSSAVMNSKTSSNISNSTSSIHENIDEQIPVKRARTYRHISVKKKPVDQSATSLLSDELQTNQPIGESTFAAVESSAVDLCNEIHDPLISLPALVIDTTNDIICSQFDIANRSVQNQSNENYDPARTPLGFNRANNNSKNVAHSASNKGSSTDISQKEISTNSNTTSASISIRTPTAGRNTTNRFSQMSNRSIVVSADRCRRNSNEENIYNHRTSTPHPPRIEQINNTTQGVYNNSFSIDCIPAETKNVLLRFPEFRHLVKEYKKEQQKCKTWMNDYAALKRNYDRLEQNSFPRPPAPALNYLTDLVTRIQQSNGSRDSRSDEQLATDMGINRMVLVGLRHTTPQQTALNLFNHFYPGYAAKTELDSINNMEILKPGLLEAILVFAQRAAPGVPYGLHDIRETLGNSIRGARYHFRKKNGNLASAAAVLENNNLHEGDPRTEDNQNTSHNNSTDVIDININKNYGDSTFHHNDDI